MALPELLALEWVDPGEPTPGGGRAVRSGARRHRTGPARTGFGAAWPGFIGSLPQDNTPTTGRWPALVRPSDGSCRTCGCRSTAARSTGAGRRLVEQVIDADRRVRRRRAARPGCTATCGRATCSGARTTGSGWSTRPRTAVTGRPTWPSSRSSAARRTWTGSSAAYQEAWPLADGWRERVPLHQLHLLLVHTALFGAAYREAVRRCRPSGAAGVSGRATVEQGEPPAPERPTGVPRRPVRPDRHRPAGLADRQVQPALHLLHAGGRAGLAGRAGSCSPTTRSCGWSGSRWSGSA